MKLKKILNAFVDTRAAGLYFILFAAAIGIATFIENDFGTSAAQKVIFKAWWFELLLALFGLTIIVNIFKFRMIQQKKWALLMFHSAIIVIIIGAGVTRYFGFEGVMHIRENGTANSFLSAETYLKFEVIKNGKTYNFDEPVLFASLGNNHFKEEYSIAGDLIAISVKDFIPNPEQQLADSEEEGLPTLKLVVGGANGRQEYYIQKGQTRRIDNVLYNFKDLEMPEAVNLKYSPEDGIWFKYNRPVTQTVMATQKRDTLIPDGTFKPLLLRTLYSDGINNFVFSEFQESGTTSIISKDPKVRNDSNTAVVLDISVNGERKETYVYGNKGLAGNASNLYFNDLQISSSYGAKEISVPFKIKLNKFILDKYPGTNSASSYASEVTVIDASNNPVMDYRIFMNNILDYEGYRFFQSSFDRDEKGTYLSVNSDWWGTIISYIGYALLTLGMIWTLFSKKTHFYNLIQKTKKLRAKSGTFVVIALLASFSLSAQNDKAVQNAVGENHSELFSSVVVQDFKGRMKPVHTLSRELMRKVHRNESYKGLTADQVLLSMFANKQDWYTEPLIKLGKHQDVQKLLGVQGEYAAYKDFFENNGNYKLRDEVRRVYASEPIDRGVYAKELMKIDERLNILSMMFSGSLLKIIPRKNDPNNLWEGYSDHGPDDGHNHSAIASNFFNAYGNALKIAVETNDYNKANSLIEELKSFQMDAGSAVIPSSSEIKAEIFLNKLNIFTRLAGVYMLLGVAFLFFLFVSIFKPNWKLKKVYYILFAILLVGFVLHTLGLGLRWYVSGRAPWSNGYESMIYIAWTTTLAGVLFTRKSFGGLAATMILAGTILLVSTLSFLDPEITPLVPVLKSYWLTIHVSLEAGSYGFLMLGAIIGLINIILMIFITEDNKIRLKRIIQEMTYISELTLIGGLFMVSVGTYLGGVWANESWGRYWGWDAKETWALVTILVYAFILHMRFIPKLRGLFAYNVATIFGLASVIMTYYGVNYYLSGLHSYATGDPVPIPNWVYIAVVLIIIICVIAAIRKRKYPIIS